jgi:hypothetical protein
VTLDDIRGAIAFWSEGRDVDNLRRVRVSPRDFITVPFAAPEILGCTIKADQGVEVDHIMVDSWDPGDNFSAVANSAIERVRVANEAAEAAARYSIRCVKSGERLRGGGSLLFRRPLTWDDLNIEGAAYTPAPMPLKHVTPQDVLDAIDRESERMAQATSYHQTLAQMSVTGLDGHAKHIQAATAIAMDPVCPLIPTGDGTWIHYARTSSVANPFPGFVWDDGATGHKWRFLGVAKGWVLETDPQQSGASAGKSSLSAECSCGKKLDERDLTKDRKHVTCYWCGCKTPVKP